MLGPLEVDENGRLLGLGSPKQRAVIALLIAAGRRVSTDALPDSGLAIGAIDETFTALLLAFSPDGRTAALSAQTEQTVVFDVEAILAGVPATEAATVLEGSTTGPNTRVAPVAPFVFTSAGTQIRQWDIETGELRTELATTLIGSADLIALPDGSAILYQDADGVLRRFPVDHADLAALARSRVQRGFTEPECERYFETGECPAA